MARSIIATESIQMALNNFATLKSSGPDGKNLKFKARALDASTWPKNVKFREFVKRNNDTWRP